MAPTTELSNRLLLAQTAADRDAAGYTRKYPCNRLLLGFGDGAREGGEVVIAEQDEADELDRQT